MLQIHRSFNSHNKGTCERSEMSPHREAGAALRTFSYIRIIKGTRTPDWASSHPRLKAAVVLWRGKSAAEAANITLRSSSREASTRTRRTVKAETWLPRRCRRSWLRTVAVKVVLMLTSSRRATLHSEAHSTSKAARTRADGSTTRPRSPRVALRAPQ